jgi:hypothetical protein
MGQKGSRKGKQCEFERLLSNELLKENARLLWEHDGYRFRFAHSWEGCEFRWTGKRLYVTSCEALHLYQRLVLGRKKTACTSRHALYGMRKKFGDAFLQEVLPVQAQMWRTGRKSDLEREVDGSYYKYLFDKYQKGGVE